jgi:hypothetical protein
LLAYSVLRICVIGCGEGFSSQVVRKWEMDMVYSLRLVAKCPSHVTKMQFPAKLHVTPAM